MKLIKSCLVIFYCFIFSIEALSETLRWDLQTYLSEVKKSNKSIMSIERTSEGISSKYSNTNIDLSPYMQLSGALIDDQSLKQNSPTYIIDRQKIKDYSLVFGKKFKTSTTLQLLAEAQDINMIGRSPASFSAHQAVSHLGVAFSQALWKDFFGHSITLKTERESLQQKLENTLNALQKTQLLINVETLYWDYIYMQKQLELQKSSYERAKKIENWVQRRLNDGIGDKSDLLSSKGLVSLRELQLLTTQDEYENLKIKIFQVLELEKNKNIEFDFVENFEHQRSLNTSDKMIRLDSYATVLESQIKSAVVQEVKEAHKPELTLEGVYKTNNYNSEFNTVVGKIADTDRPTSTISLKLKWLFDDGAKSAQLTSTELDQQASQLKKEKALQDSEINWSELVRRHSEMSNKIKVARQMNQFQKERYKSEQDKLSKGRTITSQVITAEGDVAESELSLIKLLTEQRKIEAQANLFIKSEESLK